MTVYTASTSAELITHLNTILGAPNAPDSVRLLANTTYDDLNLTYTFPAEVIITSDDPVQPAVWRRIASFPGLDTCTFVTLDNLRFEAYNIPDDIFPLISIDNCVNCTIQNSRIVGDLAPAFARGRGVDVRGGSIVILDNNEVTDLFFGYIFNGCTDAQIINNNIWSINSDGIQLFEVNGMLIEGNWIHDFKVDIASGAHVDMIQLQSFGSTIPTDGLIIRSNILDSGDVAGNDKWTQSLFLLNEAVSDQGGGLAMYYTNFLIENNLIYNSHINGLIMAEVDGVIIRNNTVLQNLTTRPTDGGGIGAPATDPVWVPNYINFNANLNVTEHDNIYVAAQEQVTPANNFPITVAQQTFYFDNRLNKIQSTGIAGSTLNLDSYGTQQPPSPTGSKALLTDGGILIGPSGVVIFL